MVRRGVPSAARSLLLATILVSLALPGCLDATSGPTLPTEDATEDVAPVTHVLQASMHRWEHTELVVAIVPPPTDRLDPTQNPLEGLFMRAILDSIVHWKEAIDTFGSSEIRGNVSFDMRVVGVDPVPTEVDILITNGYGRENGAAIYTFTGRCLITNLHLETSDYKWMFLVSAHEFGHCLGMSHPDDHEPWYDLMSYSDVQRPSGEPDVVLDCVSNLNLLSVHEAFGPAFGREPAPQVTVTADDYFLTDCADRFLDAL